jgi:thiol-disulfide isomerase/thioredoxin
VCKTASALKIVCVIVVVIVLTGCRRPLPPVTPATAQEILHVVRESGASAVLVNVWATWCGPCRTEFPDLMRATRAYRERGLRVVLVSADDAKDMASVKKFLLNQGVDFPSYLKTGKDMEFIDALNPKWTGAIPATFVYDGAGNLRSFWEGAADYAMLDQRIREVINQKQEANQ